MTNPKKRSAADLQAADGLSRKVIAKAAEGFAAYDFTRASGVNRDVTECTRAEEQLQETRRQLALVYETTAEVLFLLAVEGEEQYRFVMVNPAFLTITGLQAEQVVGKRIDEVLPPAAQALVIPKYQEAVREKETVRWEEVSEYPTGTLCGEVAVTPVWDESGACTHLVGAVHDLTAIRRAEKELAEKTAELTRFFAMPSEILEIMTSPRSVSEIAETIVDAIRRLSGFDAVGLRLQEGEDYPFTAVAGYSDEFLRAENNLAVRNSDGGVCHNADGSVSLECTCGLVISGQTDPANPLFTAAGSAWTNDSHPLLGLSPEEDPRLHPRNRCIHVGFQSVAIIPVRAGERIFGLLHLADRRKDQFTPESIGFFEGLGGSIGVALQSKQAEDQQRAASLHARRLIEASLDPLVTISPAGRITDVNEATEAATGMPRDRLIGTDFADYFTEPSKAQAGYQRVLAEGLIRDYPLVLRNVSGALMNVEYNAVVFRNEAGELRSVFAAARDVTKRKRAEQARRASEERYRTLFEQIPEGVIVFDKDLRTLDCNQQMTLMAGRSRAELVGKRAEEAGASQGASAALEQAVRGETATWEAIEAVPGEAGKQYLSGIAAPLRGADGEIVAVVCVVTDLTERKRAEDLIEQLAFYDPLTSLANRILFRDRLRQAIDNAERAQHKVAVAVLNLDRFKLVNDSLGHSFGDKLLQAVARQLGHVVRRGDTLARLGADEFALLMPNVRSARDILAVTDKVLALCREPWQIADQTVYASASLGLALYPDDASDAQALLENAHTAMRRAKERGGDACEFYDPTMNLQANERLAMEGELRTALDEEQFVVYYQPQVDLASGEIVGAEALVRWQHPERGLVPPLEFIPLAEEIGIIRPLGEWVVQTACKETVACQAHVARPLRLAVNISARRLHSPDLVPSIRAALEESGLPPEQLEVEITETGVMVDEQVATDALNALRAMGVTVALDDFGTGFFSLSHLHRLPIDRVKIDRSFVSRIEQDADAAAIVSAVTNLAHALGLGVVAEGVETEAELAFLQHLGCDELQGYLFARPLPAEEWEAVLTAGALSPASTGKDS